MFTKEIPSAKVFLQTLIWENVFAEMSVLTNTLTGDTHLFPEFLRGRNVRRGEQRKVRGRWFQEA